MGTTLSVQPRGFTLVEMLVYLALLIGVSVAAVSFMLASADTVEQYRAERTLSMGGNAVLGVLTEAIRNSSAVDTIASTFVTDPGTLALVTATDDLGFTLASGAIVKEVNGSTVGPISPSDLTIDHVRFFYYDNTKTELVRVVFDAHVTVAGVTYSRTFRTSVVIRGSYE